MNTQQSETASKRTAGRPRALKRDDIVDAALAIVYEEGHEALSMRAIARRLDTGAATLYTYFPAQSDVEAAMVDKMLAVIHPPRGGSPKTVRQQLVAMTEAYRDLILQHPQFDAISARAPGHAALRLFNETLKVLVDAGVPIERAGLGYVLLRGVAHNQAVTMRQTQGRSSREVRRGWARELPREALSMVEQYLDSPLFAGNPQDVFRRGVELTIDQLMPELNRAPARSRR